MERGSTDGVRPLHPDRVPLVLWRRGRTSLRYLTQGQVSAEYGKAGIKQAQPVISSGKIESRTSRSSICSSRPIFPSRQSQNHSPTKPTFPAEFHDQKKTPHKAEQHLLAPKKFPPSHTLFTQTTTMPPPRWLRLLSNPFVFFAAGFLVLNAVYNVFPEPPAIQEAQARRWALAKRQREEDYERAMEQQIEKDERERPGAWERKRIDNHEEGEGEGEGARRRRD